MNLLPKIRQKRNQLFLSLVVTLIAIGGIYFGVIRPQYVKLAGLRKQTGGHANARNGRNYERDNRAIKRTQVPKNWPT